MRSNKFIEEETYHAIAEIRKEAEKQLSEIYDRHYYEKVDYIKSEQFIDDIVARIKAKQL